MGAWVPLSNTVLPPQLSRTGEAAADGAWDAALPVVLPRHLDQNVSESEDLAGVVHTIALW